MNRRSLSRSAGGLVLAAAGLAAVRANAQEARAHKLVIHVGGADPALMATALHNIANAADHYAKVNEAVAIELVANGQGYTMLRADTSPVKAQIATLHEAYPWVVLSACQASRAGFAAAEGKAPQDIPQVPAATDVPFGIVRLSELQEQDYSYVRV